MTWFARWAWLRAPLAADEDVLTRMIAVGRACLVAGAHGVNRLALASMEWPGAGHPQFPQTPTPQFLRTDHGRRVQAALVASALDLPPQTFCLECTTSERAGTEALRALGSGLLLAADGEWAAAILLGDDAQPKATVLAMQSALAAYPGLQEGASDYEEMAYLDLVQEAAAGLRADRLVLSPPHPHLAKRAARTLGFPSAITAPGDGAAGSLVGLLQALDEAPPGQTVLLISYGAGSVADALLVRREGA